MYSIESCRARHLDSNVAAAAGALGIEGVLEKKINIKNSPATFFF